MSVVLRLRAAVQALSRPAGLRVSAMTILVVFLGVTLGVGLAPIDVAEREPDEFFYFSHAVPLADTGRWGIDQGAGAELTAPVAEPAFPLLLAAAMTLDAQFGDTVRCLHANRTATGGPISSCGSDIGLGTWVLALLMGWAVAAVAAGGIVLTRRPAVGLLAAGLTLGTGLVARFGSQFLTEALILPAFCSATVLLLAWMRTRDGGASGARWLVAAGLLFGVAAVTRSTALYILPVLVMGVAWLAGGGARVRSIGLFVAGVLAVVVPVKTWAASAAVPPATAEVGDYRLYVVPYRLALNTMTAEEYAAGWLYWLPDFGDGLARSVFGEDAVARFDFGNPDGFLLGIPDRLRDEARARAEGSGTSPMDVLVREVAVEQLPMHVATTPLLIWRGMFVGKLFGLVGFVLLVAAFIRPPFRTRRRDLGILLAPAGLLLVLHAGVSINIPRYNLMLLLPLMVTGAAVILAAVQAGAGALARAASPADHEQAGKN